MMLLDFQRRMAEDVTRPLCNDFTMQTSAPNGSPISERVANYVKPNHQLSSFERVEIYNRQYWFRLIAAVSEDFPALNAVLGGRRFDKLIRAYLTDNPSTSFSLRDLGAKLPSWLVHYTEFSVAQHDLAVDVARLEWAYIEAFDSATLPPLDATDLATLGPESVLCLQPHIQLLALQYAADELVLEAHKIQPTTGAASNAVTAKKISKCLRVPRPQRSLIYLVVHRYHDSVYYRRIDQEEFQLLTAIQSSDPLAAVISKAFRQTTLAPGEQIAKIREYFAHAAELGWLVISG
jgi:Putative DNA-binding domain